MKFKFYSFLFIILNFSGNIMAQNIKFTNDELKKHLLSSSPENEVAKDINGNPMAIDANRDGEISIQEALNVYQLKVGMGNIYPKKPSWDNSKTNFSSELTYFTNVRVFKYEGLIDHYNCDVCVDYFVDATGFTNLEELYFLDGHFFYKRYHLNIKLPEYLPNLKIVDAPIKISYSQAPNLEELNCSYTYQLGSGPYGLRDIFKKLIFSDFLKLKRITANAENLTLSNLPSLVEVKLNAKDNLILKNLPSLEHMDIFAYNYHLENIGKVENFEFPKQRVDFEDQLESRSVILKNFPLLKTLIFPYQSDLINIIELEDLPELIKLTIYEQNYLSSLDLSKNIPKLESLDINTCMNLQELNISTNRQLGVLSIYNVPLNKLDLSNNTQLKKLKIQLSSLSSLNLRNNKELKELDIDNCKISELDLSQQAKLETLKSNRNFISKLDLSNNPIISNLFLGFNMNYPFAYNEVGALKELNLKNNVIDNWLKNMPDESYYFGNKKSFSIKSICCDNQEEIDLIYKKIIPKESQDSISVTTNCNQSLGTDEIKKQTEVTLYPNPATDFLYINTKEKITKVEIFDANGRLLISENITSPKVTVSTLPKGSYFMTLHYAKGKINKPFIKN